MTEQNPEMDTAAEDAKAQAWTEAAQAQEQAVAMEATIIHLQRRAVALNVEVRVRDERIAHLESEVGALQALKADRDDDALERQEAGTEPDSH